jgi:hypothetical protein
VGRETRTAVRRADYGPCRGARTQVGGARTQVDAEERPNVSNRPRSGHFRGAARSEGQKSTSERAALRRRQGNYGARSSQLRVELVLALTNAALWLAASFAAAMTLLIRSFLFRACMFGLLSMVKASAAGILHALFAKPAPMLVRVAVAAASDRRLRRGVCGGKPALRAPDHRDRPQPAPRLPQAPQARTEVDSRFGGEPAPGWGTVEGSGRLRQGITRLSEHDRSRRRRASDAVQGLGRADGRRRPWGVTPERPPGWNGFPQPALGSTTTPAWRRSQYVPGGKRVAMPASQRSRAAR